MRIFLHCARGPRAASPAVRGLLHARPHAVAGDCAGSLAHGGRVSSGSCSGFRIALAQLAPTLGALEDNLDRHRAVLAEAKAGGANLIVFPELGLTGYLLQDLAAEVAMRLDDARLASLVADTRGVSTCSRSWRSRRTIGCSSRPCSSRTAIRHVHRKLFLPTYGLFDERRFFAAGDLLRAVPSGSASGSGSPCARTSGTSRSHSRSRSTARRSSSTCPRRRAATWRRRTRWGSGPQRRGGR